MMKIYIDILLISNALITLVFLKILCLAAHTKLPGKRMLSGAGTGALSSLLMLVRPDNYGESLLLTIIKLLFTFLTVFAAFGRHRLLSRYVGYIVINIVFGGICMIFWEMAGGDFIRIKNYTVYFNVPMWLLIVCVAAAYLLLTLYEKITFISGCRTKKYKAEFSLGDISVTLPAVSDTGNKLTDSFSGEPVVIFCSDRLYSYFDLDDESRYPVSGFHLIPYKTVNSSSLMAVTLKGSVTVSDDSGDSKTLSCAAGITKSGGKERAIFDPRLLI